LNQLVKPWIRWTGWLLVAIVFAVACVALASWQIDRRSEAVSKIERVSSNYTLDPLGFSNVSILEGADVVSFEWRQILLSGRYITDGSLLVRNRAVAGQPGFIQLIPFELESGEIVIVERGWIAADSNLEANEEFLPTDAKKEIIARLRLSESVPNRKSPAGQVTSINLPELKTKLALPVKTDFYVQLISESPDESSYPQPLSKPVLDEGNHLSYAVQWILFALMGFFALFWAIRQEREFKRMENDPNYVPKSSKRRKNVDSIVEDDILDRSS